MIRLGCPARVHCWGLQNRKRICLLHSHQFPIFFWCVFHHRVGVACNAHSSAPYCCCFGIALSNLSKNSSTPVTPSYVGSSLASVVTYRSDLIIMLQFSVDISCNWFCQHSISSSEFEVSNCCAPTRFSHLLLGSPDLGLVPLSGKCNPSHYRCHHRAQVRCSVLLRMDLAELLRIETFSQISSSASSG